MTIEKTAARVVARSETLSLPAGLTLVASLMAWMAVAGMNLPGAWVDGSWARASRPLIAIGLGTLAFGGSALFALGHQRITLSTAGLENAWVVFRPIRRRFVPLADITSIDTVRIAGDEIHSTYLSVRSKTRQAKWTLFTDDPGRLRDEIRATLRTIKRQSHVERADDGSALQR